MSFEIKSEKPKKIDFTFNGKQLFTRSISLRMGLKLQNVTDGDVIPSDIVSEFISSCVVYKDGSNVWGMDEVLDFDAAAMMKLFAEVSGISTSVEEAEKN